MLKKFLSSATGVSPQPNIYGLLQKLYHEQIAKKIIVFDEAQWTAIQRLQELLENLLIVDKPGRPLLGKPKRCRGIYIFGAVGRGKSMLMDLLYSACPFTQKRRVHFHAFMLEVHDFIFECRQQKQHDAIPTLAKKIRETTLLLCFDEFNVTDIADAMILQRLFTELFAAGVVIVMTSNRHPKDVYHGGLLKEQFLLFTQLLLDHVELIELTGKDDYRLSRLASARGTYYYPLDAKAKQLAEQWFQTYADCQSVQPGVLKVLGRTLTLAAVARDVVIISFAELCGQPLGPADYLKIASEFNTVILVEIPKLTVEMRNEAKRFITLIDALYENRVRLICTAQVPATELYTEGDGSFEFARTVSRLIEMQSDYYLSQNLLAADEW